MSGSERRMLPQHAALIAASAIAPAVAEARGYRSVTDKRELEPLGFTPAQRRVPTFLVPIHDVHGQIALHQHRPDNPRMLNGKPIKYETPAGAALCLDVPPPARERLGDPTVDLLVTEGSRKADAAVSAGGCCIALLGVWGWRGRNAKDGRTALGDWEAIALKSRRVLLAFDSDVVIKPQVHVALERLAAFLSSRGAVVRVIYLPASDDGGKVGLDDFLAAGQSVEELLALAIELRGAPDRSPLPQITVPGRPLRDRSDDAIAALRRANNPPNVFVRGGRLVRIRVDERGRPAIELLGEHELRGLLARTADFIAEGKHVSPPVDIVHDVLTVGRWPFPALETIVEAPVLRADGSVLDIAGYDERARVVYAPAPGLVVPPVPPAPSRAEVEAARALLCDELLADFPFVDQASRANALALLVTPIVRVLIDGLVPLALLDKPQAGTGATLLADVIAIIATGRPGATMSDVGDDEEWRKQITSILLDGATFVLIDNAAGRLRSKSLARALTSTTWKDRVLGKSVSVELRQRAVWLATGNNLRVGGDLARRSYWIRIDAKMARPYLREESAFWHSLPEWAVEQRGSLLAAILTIVRGWVIAGRPAAKTVTLGGFTAWAKTLGAVLAFAGVDDFLGNMTALYEQIDDDASAWEAFLVVWFETFGERAVRVAEIETEVRRDASPLRDALPLDLTTALEKKRFTKSLGYALRARVDQVIGDLRLERAAKDEHAKVARWRVMRTIAREENADKSRETSETRVMAGDVSPDATRARARYGDRPKDYPPSPASPAPDTSDSSVIPSDPCRVCRTVAWWRQPSGLIVCGTCHPPPLAATQGGVGHGR